MEKGQIKVVVGSLGLLGLIMCGSSVVAWTLRLGMPQNYVGAALVAVLCGCAALCCMDFIFHGRNGQ